VQERLVEIAESGDALGDGAQVVLARVEAGRQLVPAEAVRPGIRSPP
jgi:hypothetical protein